MSRRVAAIINGFIHLATLPLNKRQRHKTIGYVAHAINRDSLTKVKTARGNIKFFALRGSGIASAVISMENGTNETETMEWIDTCIKDHETLWDIGANLGMYALYAALNPKITVLAFEPGAIDFNILVEHIAANNMSGNLKPFCIAMSGETKIDTLYMKKFETGCGGNTLGSNVLCDQEFTPLFAQASPAFSGDDFRKIFKLNAPDHIKLDVDGIEGAILSGLKETLPHVKSICIEVEGENVERAAERIEAPLFTAGFKEDVSYRTKGSKRNRLFIQRSGAA